MHRRKPSTDLFRRLIAAGMTALVLALTVFAASPAAHNLLHKQDGPGGDDRCAVVLFASGVSVPFGMVAVVPPAFDWQAPAPVVAEELSLTSPRYLRQPERGPPALG